MKKGYVLDSVKINYLLFLDDLKLFARDEDEILKRGKLTKSRWIERANGKIIKEVGEEGYNIWKSLISIRSKIRK